VRLSLLNSSITGATLAQIAGFNLLQINEGEVQILSLPLQAQRQISPGGQNLAVVRPETPQPL
jgi:hypothetical protein